MNRTNILIRAIATIPILFLVSGCISVSLNTYISTCYNKEDLTNEEQKELTEASYELISHIQNKKFEVIYDQFIKEAKFKSSAKDVETTLIELEKFFGKISTPVETLYVFKINSTSDQQVLCQENINGQTIDYKIGPLIGFNEYVLIIQKALTDQSKELLVESYFINQENTWKIHTFNIKPLN